MTLQVNEKMAYLKTRIVAKLSHRWLGDATSVSAQDDEDDEESEGEDGDSEEEVIKELD